MNRDMVGRRLVVTGAARGIGEKVARLTASWREAVVRDSAALQSAIDDCAQLMGGIAESGSPDGRASTRYHHRSTRWGPFRPLVAG
jgi:NAD(P)-dependent dehydrogenase (short-subunit alcohol dehydrogenase family)